jgi:hypothetical protein
MKNIPHLERLAQLTIISVCLIVLIFRFSSDYICALNGCLPDKPPILSTVYGTSDPIYYAWPQGTNVSVVIYDRAGNQPTSEEEFNAIDSAIKEWNGVKDTGCSNCTMGSAARAGIAWNGSTDVPAGEIWVVRTTTAGAQWQRVMTDSGMKSGLMILPDDSNPQHSDPHHRIDNLSKHEAGHSYGIGNGNLSDPPSIYAENSNTGPGNFYVITECDIEAHKKVYCPTPTPTSPQTPDTPVTPTTEPTESGGGGCFGLALLPLSAIGFTAMMKKRANASADVRPSWWIYLVRFFNDRVFGRGRSR